MDHMEYDRLNAKNADRLGAPIFGAPLFFVTYFFEGGYHL